jgi:hypothetical protein
LARAVRLLLLLPPDCAHCLHPGRAGADIVLPRVLHTFLAGLLHARMATCAQWRAVGRCMHCIGTGRHVHVLHGYLTLGVAPFDDDGDDDHEASGSKV